MKKRLHDAEAGRIEHLLLDIARVYHLTGLYAPGHPALAGRIDALRASLSGEAGHEPSGILLLGIARDRVLFRDRFLGGDHPLLGNFTEVLFRRHVATLEIAEGVTAGEIAVFFRCLHGLRSGKIEDPPEEYLIREGIRGIRLSPVNYKEVLSRGILATEASAGSESRQEALWRALLSAHLPTEDDERKIIEELSDVPELLPLIMKRAVAAAGGPAAPSVPGDAPGFITPDVLRRMFRRLGLALKVLPAKRRKELLGHLVEGVAPPGSESERPVPEATLEIARSMAEAYSDREFLELLASLLSLEEKGGKRLLRAFEIIAAERDVRGSLLPLLRTWKREDLRKKKYFAAKTWEAIERLLLDRGEKPNVEEDHAALLERLSTSPGKTPGVAPAGREVAPLFSDEAIVRRGLAVLVELLLSEKRDAEFLDLLAVLEKAIPRLIDGRDFDMLDRVMASFLQSTESGTPPRKAAANDALRSVDFHRIADAILAGPGTPDEKNSGAAILSKHGALAAEALLRKLQVEEGPGRRKILLSLVSSLGEKAVPSILSRFEGQRWFFLRNLCFLLGEIGAPAGIPPLVGMLSAREPKLRREAVQALGKIRRPDPDAIAALGRTLLREPFFSSSNEVPVRIDAAIALSRIGGTEATAFLHIGKSSRRKAVRDQCESLLRARGTG